MRDRLIYTVLCLTLVFSSCNDWLDVSPKTQKSMDKVFETTQGFQDALTACYIKMNGMNLYGMKLTVTDIEYLAQHWSFNESNHRDEVLLKNFEYDTDYAKSTLKSIYSGLYNTIAQANAILENIPSHGNVMRDEDVRAVVEAEALGVRAFCHMDILRLFGQMPQNAEKKVELAYVKTVSTAPEPYYGFDDFVNLIMQDIDAAMVLLKAHDPLFKYSFKELDNFSDTRNYTVELQDDFLGYRRFRFNYYALKALKARLYMYLGDKTKAYEEAKGVIDALDKNGKKMLTLAGEEDFGLENYALPSECILALSNYNLESTMKPLFENGSNGLYLTPARYTNDLFAGQTTAQNNRAMQIWREVAATPKYMRYMKYHQPENSASSESSELATQKQVVPLIRLSEMYLIVMESATSLTEINAFYKEYMKARNIDASPLTQNDVMTEIMREYRREFYGEGVMFYTYKRLGEKQMLWKDDREVGENDYVAPLPDTEINMNINKEL